MRSRASMLQSAAIGAWLVLVPLAASAQSNSVLTGVHARSTIAVPGLSAAESAAALGPIESRPAIIKPSKALAEAVPASDIGPDAPISTPSQPTPPAAPPAPATLPVIPVLKPPVADSTPTAPAMARAVPTDPVDAAAFAAPPAGPQTPDAVLAAAVADVLYDRLATMTLPAKKGEMAKKGDAVNIAAFYASRGYKPAWTSGGRETATTQAALARLGQADQDGLDPAAYGVSGLDVLTGSDAAPDRIADAEIAISTAVLTYARQAAGGRVDPMRITKDISITPHLPNPVGVLADVSASADPAMTLDGYNPLEPEYLALKKKLAEIRAADAAAAASVSTKPTVPPGPPLRLGMTDARVVVLRTRLGMTLSDDDTFDDTLAEAVRSFQRDSNIKANGIVGPQTLAALNGALPTSKVSTEDEIIANMERWRWLPRDLGAFHVLVNVPEYHLQVMRDGAVVHDAKVVVGKPGTPTPLFSDMMKFVVFNPSWNVPQSIIKKEFLPKLADDPSYLSRHGYVVTYHGDQISVRQPPGESNALGHIKFMFPNNFSVYLHDTSQRNLFSADKRAFSHGCVRVDDPYKFAEIVMGPGNGWTEDHVKKMIGRAEQSVKLAQQVPVHIAYFTAKVDENGELQTVNDIYGYDRAVVAALNSPH